MKKRLEKIRQFAKDHAKEIAVGAVLAGVVALVIKSNDKSSIPTQSRVDVPDYEGFDSIYDEGYQNILENTAQGGPYSAMNIALLRWVEDHPHLLGLKDADLDRLREGGSVIFEILGEKFKLLAND